jgi:hypothetical protein
MDFGNKKYPNYRGVIPDGGIIYCTKEILKE